MAIDAWAAFALASLIVVTIPGPTVLLVCGYALSVGRRVGLAMAAGVALGDFVAMTASLLGLGAVLLSSATLFQALKLIGAAYLIYLGISLWRAPDTIAPPEEADDRVTPRTAFWRAFAVTATNPKGIVFFVAFVPQFVDLNAPAAPQLAIMVATFVALGALNALAYAILADRLRPRLAGPGALRWINRLGGAGLVAMGVAAAAARRA